MLISANSRMPAKPLHGRERGLSLCGALNLAGSVPTVICRVIPASLDGTYFDIEEAEQPLARGEIAHSHLHHRLMF